MDTKDILLFLGPLLGILIGGGVTTVVKWMELRQHWKFERRRIRVDRLETLHAALNDIIREVSRQPEQLSKIRHNVDVSKRQAEYTAVTDDLLKKLAMIDSISSLYAPKLRPNVTEMMSRWTSLYKACKAFLFEEDPEWDREISKKVNAVLFAANRIQLQISAEIECIENPGNHS